MKKLLSCLLVAALVLSFGALAFADDFEGAGTALVSALDEAGTEVTADVALVSYADRNSLAGDALDALEAAMSSLKVADLATLNETLKERLVEGKLAVSDLFDLSAADGLSFPLTVTLRTKMDSFVGLLHYVDSKWDWLEVERKADGLTFTVDAFSPFVIVGLAGPEAEAPAAAFVGSVTNAGGPKVVNDAAAAKNDKNGAIVATPYLAVASLPQDEAAALTEAYESLANAEDLGALNAELKDAAADREIAVSDVFSLRAVGEVELPADITLKSEGLDNLVGVLQYVNGAWEWVDVKVNGDEVSFTADELGPFAFVALVDGPESPATGSAMPISFLLGIVVLSTAAGWFFLKSRRCED